MVATQFLPGLRERYELGLIGPGRWAGFQPPIYTCGFSDQIEDVDKDGCVLVPDGPGMGVSYDWDKIESWTTDRHAFT